MTTVAELIDYLEKLPPDTKVKVLKEDSHGYETTTDWVELNLLGDSYYFNDYNNTLYLGDK